MFLFTLLFSHATAGFLSAGCGYEQSRFCGNGMHACLNGSDCVSLCGPRAEILRSCSSSCLVVSRPEMSSGVKRTHFRASPLSYYTPDGRKHFSPGRYGVRLSWLWSEPRATCELENLW